MANSGNPSNAFSILCRHATNRVLDTVRKAKRVNLIALDEVTENLATRPQDKSPSTLPSEAEMEKAIKDAGLSDPLMANLIKPEFWEDCETKPNYQLLAEHHQTTVNNIQKRVSRYRKLVLKRFATQTGFLSIAARTLAMIRQSPSWVAKAFILIGSTVAVVLVASQIHHLLKTRPEQNPTPVNQPTIAAITMTTTNAISDVKGVNKIDTNSGLFVSDPSTDLAQDTQINTNPSAMSVEGTPDEVVIFYMAYQRKKVEGISVVLKQSVAKVSLIEVPVPIGSNGPDDEGYVFYNKDTLNCAKYVQNLLIKIEAGQPFQIRLIEGRPNGQEIKVDALTWQSAKRTVWIHLPPSLG